jgi:dihydrofolate synthase/folylpolyglutamate synthase
VDYAQSLAYISGLTRFGVRPGLCRVRAMLEELGHPEERWPSIHVAGTNGKGSVTAFCASVLGAAGMRVGRYHSPYVFDFRERIQIGEEMISKDRFAAMMTRIVPLAEAVSELDEMGPVTEFELKTTVAFRYFADEAVDAAVVEAGMGGRLDATNVLLPRVAVVTNVGIDHTAILGETTSAIAREKGGIIKPGSRFVTACTDAPALDVLCALAREMMAGFTHVRHASTRPTVHGRSVVWWEENGLNVRTPRMRLRGLRLGMLGPHQCENAAVAVAAVEAFADSYGITVPPEAYIDGLGSAVMPGRMQIVGRGPLVLLDGAHNRDAAAAVRIAVSELVGDGRLHVVVGMTRGHDPGQFLAALTPVSGSLVLTQPSDPRCMPLDQLRAAADDFGLTYVSAETVTEALAHAMAAAAPNDAVLVTGSFYTVGDCASVAGIAASPSTAQATAAQGHSAP